MERDNLRQSQIDARFLASNDDEFGDNLKEKCMEVFRMFDADGSGTIDASEFQELAFCLGETLTDEEAKAYIEKLDSDGNGVIDFNEFYAWWKSGSSNPLSQSSQTLPSEKLNVLKLKLRSQVFMRSIKNIFSRVNVTQEKVVKDSINIDIGLKVGDLSKLESSDTGKMIFRLRSIEHPVGNKVVAKFLLNENVKEEDEQKLKSSIDVLTELVSLLAPESVPKIAFVDHPTLSKRRVMVVEVGFPAPPIPPINIPFDFTFEVKGNEKSKASLIRLHGNVSKSLVDFGAMMSKGKVPPAGLKVGKALNKISFQLEFDELDMEELSQSMMRANPMFTEQRLLATATDPNAQNLIKLTQALQKDAKQFKDPVVVQKFFADMMRPFWNQPQAENPFADPLKELYYNIVDFVSGIESVTANVHTFQADWVIHAPQGKTMFQFLPTKEMLKPTSTSQQVELPSLDPSPQKPSSTGGYIKSPVTFTYSSATITKLGIIDPNTPGLSPLESKVAKNTISYLTRLDPQNYIIIGNNGTMAFSSGESFVTLPEYIKNNSNNIPEDKIKKIAHLLVSHMNFLKDKNVLVTELSINDYLYSEADDKIKCFILDTATKGPKYSALGSDAILNVCNVSHDLVANGDVDMSVYGWHLGVILYQLVTGGKHPCATDKTGEEGDKEMITKLKNITADWESSAFSSAPSTLQDLIKRLLVKRDYRLSLDAVKSHEFLEIGDYKYITDPQLGITFSMPSDWKIPTKDTLSVKLFAKYDETDPELKDDKAVRIQTLGVIPESVRKNKLQMEYLPVHLKQFLIGTGIENYLSELYPVQFGYNDLTAMEFNLPTESTTGEQARVIIVEDNQSHRVYLLSFTAGASVAKYEFNNLVSKIITTMSFQPIRDEAYMRWNRVASAVGKYSIAHPSGSSIVKEGSTLKFANHEIIAKYLESADELPTHSPYGALYSLLPIKVPQGDGFTLEYHLSEDRKHIRTLAKRSNGHVLVVEQQQDPQGDNIDVLIKKHVRISKAISFKVVEDSQDEYMTYVSTPVTFKVPENTYVLAGTYACTIIHPEYSQSFAYSNHALHENAKSEVSNFIAQTAQEFKFARSKDVNNINFTENNIEFLGVEGTSGTTYTAQIIGIRSKPSGADACTVSISIFSNITQNKQKILDTTKSLIFFQ